MRETYLDTIYIDGSTLDEAIKELSNLRDEHAGKGWAMLKVQVKVSGEDDYEIELIGYRESTAEEIEADKRETEEHERAELARLQAKYSTPTA